MGPGRHFVRGAIAVSVILALHAPTRAMEGGQSAYIKGYRDFLTGVLPAQGVHVRHDLYLYSGTERSTVPQGQLTLGVKQISNILGVTVVTPYRIFGGDYGFAVRSGVTNIDADQTLVTLFGPIRRNGNLSSLNDVVINPIMVGWHAGNFHWNVLGAVFMPAGNYDRNRLANSGRNVWALSPQFGLTYFDPKSGWEISGAAVYIRSSTNTDTNYRSGDIAHFDFAAGRMVSPQLKLGAVGYYVQQLTADSGVGAVLGHRKMRVLGVGPAAIFTFSVNEAVVSFVAKYYREFDAQNTSQGDAGSLSLRVKF